MSISSRIHDTLETWSSEWGDRLHTWIMDWISAGIIKFIETIEPEGLEFVDEGLAQPSDAPGTPPMIQHLIARIRAGGKPIPLLLLIPIGVLMLFPIIMGLFQPLQKIINYGQERLFHSGRMNPETAIRAVWRGLMTDKKMRQTLEDHGFDDEDVTTLLNVTKFYPGPQDLVSWQAREVFEPLMVKKYGLLDEIGNLQRDAFYKAGMTDEQIDNYWKAHWIHASWMQVVEMLHRGLVSEADVYEWFKVVEIPPYWRDLLIKTAYTWPTRVDVRRWWDMRTIDETELRRLYSGMGYRGVNLENYILWTKVYVAFPDLMARWSKGWITLDDVRRELTGLGMPADRLEEMIQTKIKPTVQEPVNDAKKVSQTAIIKWVKEDTAARWEQGIDLLMDLGYDEAGARFILDAYIADMGSPETYEEFKELTSHFRRAAGMTTPAFNDKLRSAGAELIRATEEVKVLEESVKAEEFLMIDQDVIEEISNRRLKELRVALNRARSEKVRLQDAYNALVAEFRHTEV